VSRDDQLRWEARWGRPAAGAAFLAALLTLFSLTVFLPRDRKGIEATADFLLSVHDDTGAYLTSAIMSAVAALLLAGVFFYLFRAVTARGGGVPDWFVYMVIAAPVAYAISRVAYSLEATDIADKFASGEPIRGKAGGDRATDLSDVSPVVVALQIAGTVGVAFLYVMLPLRARRIGLLSQFMGVLGAIAGALVVLPFAGVSPVIQAFWLGAVAMIFLGRWPGGRGPAWESGEAEPWPTAAQRRAELLEQQQQPEQPPPEEQQPPTEDQQAEPEPVPERPASRKRRKRGKR
jgi:hypothetical protein